QGTGVCGGREAAEPDGSGCGSRGELRTQDRCRHRSSPSDGSITAVTAHLPFPSECGDRRRLTGKLAVGGRAGCRGKEVGGRCDGRGGPLGGDVTVEQAGERHSGDRLVPGASGEGDLGHLAAITARAAHWVTPP